MPTCPFCDHELIQRERVLEHNSCVFLSGKGYNPEGVLVGAGIIIPFSHKATPFELTEQEMADILTLLKKVKKHIDSVHQPDGYSLGWNVGAVSGQAVDHVHLHVMPRYHDEPLAGKGIRHFLKQTDNRRRG